MSQNRNNKIVLNAFHVAKPLVSLESNKNFLDARNIMERYYIKRIVITSPEDKKPIGIITEKDIGRFLSSHLDDKRNLEEVLLEEFLQDKKNLYAVNKNSSLGVCVQIMLDKNISSLLILDEKNHSNKIITKTDLIALIATHGFGNFIVREYMTKNVISVSPEEDISLIPSMMSQFNISRIVVIKENKPIGIITSRDIIPKGKYLTFKIQSKGFKNAFNEKKTNDAKLRKPIMIKDMMTTDPLVIDEGANLFEAAKIMIENRISGIPVVNNSQEIVGIITKTDIIKAIADMGRNE